MKVARLLIVAVTMLAACSQHQNKFADKQLAHIADLQDRRLADSLYNFLNSENALYRLEAARALGNIQDSTSAVYLGNMLLEDADPMARRAAAFALGQIGNFSSVNALLASNDSDPMVVAEVLEARGKCVSKAELSASMSQPISSDTIIQNGQAWGIYYAGLRNAVDSSSVKTAISLIGSSAYYARLATAHFFSRSSYPVVPGVEGALIELTNAPIAELRMVALNALRKFTTENSLAAISKAITTDADYRVRVNATRALRNFPWTKSKDLFGKALQDANPNVGIAAAELINSSPSALEILNRSTLLEWARSNSNGRSQAILFESALTLEQSTDVMNEVIDIYKKSTNPYQRSWLLAALSTCVDAYPFIREALNDTVKVVKSSAADALATINRSKSFRPALKNEFATIYKDVIADGDLGGIISACNALRDSTLGYKELFKDHQFLIDARGKLSLPRDYETWVPLEQTIAYFENKPPPPAPSNKFNHPIDWTLARSIAPDQEVMIETSKGKIVLRLFVEEAPGSVVNFVKLVTDRYFDEKYFHRVVPNFVIQTGCNRGDGFGSEDYSIRTEVSGRKYKTGTVGMASAGKDTEGTQWFITHSPTPHLNTGYSVFAEVVSGMDAVHQIEVGDKIISASLVRK